MNLLRILLHIMSPYETSTRRVDERDLEHEIRTCLLERSLEGRSLVAGWFFSGRIESGSENLVLRHLQMTVKN